jgi:DNA-binding GntR family transcriptional regulator
MQGVAAIDRAYLFAKQRILDGRLPGGELISEGDVAVAVGLSRTPVREAFLRLEAEGLLRLYPKRGALVVPVSAAEVEDVMESRQLLERFAVEKVIGAGHDLRAQLEDGIARQEGLDGPGFVEADREFHRIVVAAAGNAILLQLYDALRDRQSRMNLVALSRDDHRRRRILQEHRALAAAIAAGDERLARTRLEEHLHGTLVLLRGGPAAPRASWSA